MKKYNPPFLSKVARFIANKVLPDRVWAACAIGALHMLDDHLVEMEIHDEDGGITFCYGITAIQIENIRRRIWKQYLKTVAK